MNNGNAGLGKYSPLKRTAATLVLSSALHQPNRCRARTYPMGSIERGVASRAFRSSTELRMFAITFSYRSKTERKTSGSTTRGVSQSQVMTLAIR